MVDGKPKYVTALGETNVMGGWRANKAKGGILMDIDSGEILCRGLSMPHSARFSASVSLIRMWKRCGDTASTAINDPGRQISRLRRWTTPNASSSGFGLKRRHTHTVATGTVASTR